MPVTGPVNGFSSTFSQACPIFKSRGVRPAAMPALRFAGADAVTINETLDKRRPGHLLIPSGTPIFYLHGTFKDAHNGLVPMTTWVEERVSGIHPGYHSFIPEIEDATGIRKTEDPVFDPAYLMVLRDLGDFRYQLVRNNIHKLSSLNKAGDDALGQYFDILPPLRGVLAPLLREHLLKPLTELPTAFEELGLKRPLACMADETVAKVLDEVNKVHPTEEEAAQAVYDTHFLATKAREQNMPLNASMGIHHRRADVVNLRSIDLEDVARLECYLMAMESRLEKAVAETFRNYYPETVDNEAVARRAQMTTQKLMDKLAPRGLAFGHSQGGVVLHTALMEYFRNAPKSHKDALNLNTAGAEHLAGRFIGIASYFSAPLNGVPEIPAFGDAIMNEMRESHIGFLVRPLQWLIWQLFEKDRPGITEMRAGSPLIKSLKTDLHLLDGKTTIISASDVSDIFVEPRASILMDHENRTPDFVFNVELETELMPPEKKNGDEVLETLRIVVGPGGVRLLKKLPDKIKNLIYRMYLNQFVPLQQHSALLDRMNEVTVQIGEDLIINPANHRKVLDTHNFEPFRYQSLIARSKSFHKRIISKPTPEAAKLLWEFSEQYPLFLYALIENAKETLPLSTAASTQAREVLNESLDLIERIMADEELRTRYKKPIMRQLTMIAESGIEPISNDPGEETPASRAQALLKQRD